MTREELKRHCEATCKMFRNGRTTSRTYMEHRLVLDLLEQTELTSVNEEPKTGHWIQTNEFFINQDGQFIYKFICSECKSLSYFRKSNKKAIGANVCPNCGCHMVESQESEEEE